MKIINIFLMFSMLAIAFVFTGCNRNSNTVWEDSKSAGRHMKRGIRTLGGKHGDSRQVRSRDDFMYAEETACPVDMQASTEYVPLMDAQQPDELAMAEYVSQPPRETPGEPGSSIPGLDSFIDPATDPRLSNVFKNVHFEYNSYLIKGTENLEIIRNVADYLKKHADTYVFVEGHTDERGPEAYNLALGSHRSNSVRNLLISEGVSPDNVFTISYGKERPLVLEHLDAAWSQNRRAEFKVYNR